MVHPIFIMVKAGLGKQRNNRASMKVPRIVSLGW